MKEKQILTLKHIAHYVLFVISSVLSINLFIQFSDNLWNQLIFGGLALALEIMKVYTLVLAKAEFKYRRHKHSVIVGIGQSTLYLGLAVISTIASLGFSMVVLNEKSENLESEVAIEQLQDSQIDLRIEQLKARNENTRNLIDRKYADIDRKNVEIEGKLRQIANLPTDEQVYVNTSERFSAQINEIEVEIVNIQVEINTLEDEYESRLAQIEALENEKITIQQSVLETKESQSSNAAEMFDLLAEAVNSDGISVMTMLLFVLSGLLEAVVAITAGELAKEPEKAPVILPEIERVVAYVEALFNGKGNRLASQDSIKKEARMGDREFKEIKKFVENIKWNGKPILESRQGGVVNNYTKDNIITLVKHEIKRNS